MKKKQHTHHWPFHIFIQLCISWCFFLSLYSSLVVCCFFFSCYFCNLLSLIFSLSLCLVFFFYFFLSRSMFGSVVTVHNNNNDEKKLNLSKELQNKRKKWEKTQTPPIFFLYFVVELKLNHKWIGKRTSIFSLSLPLVYAESINQLCLLIPKKAQTLNHNQLIRCILPINKFLVCSFF